MRPTMTTLKNLMEYVERLAISEKTVVLYLYYCIHGKDAPRREDIKKGTGFNFKTIRKHDEVLELIGAIKRGPKQGRGKGSIVEVFAVNKPTIPLLHSILYILNIPSQKIQYNQYKKEGEDGEGYGMFSKSDIEKDEDWIMAKKYLEASFKEWEISPRMLSGKKGKKKFSALVELLHDESVDFGAYCKWFATNKYPEKGFNYGLFLFPGMVEEFKDYMERDGKYLKTTSRMADSDSFKSGVKRTKEFLKSLEDDE